MRVQKYLMLMPFLYFTSVSHAGLYATTVHSRANCFNNESITWYAGHANDWRVVSFHVYNFNRPGDGRHYIDTGMTRTWRQAAVHWNESAPGGKYLVEGFHYFSDGRGHQLLDANTSAVDCSIYDGWWD
jgi:hypothetical protein